jgi:hypothetical protein
MIKVRAGNVVIASTMNTELTEAIERLLQAVADYKEFVNNSRSMQLAKEGAREASNANE